MKLKKNDNVPEIRLDGFEGEWEEKCIGELADIVRGASPRPIQDPKWFDSNSEIGWLRISDVTSQNGRIHSLEQKISKLGQEKTRVLTEPHLLLSIAATVGKPVVNYVKTGVHDGFLIFMDPKFDREFMFQWLEMYREKWNRYGQPGSQVNLNSDIVKNQKILIPCMEEQQAIGSLFSTLDDLLSSYKDNLANYQSLKATMLSKMFPKAGQTVPEIRLDGFEGEWELIKLGEVCNLITKGTTAKSQSEQGKVNFVKVENLKDNEIYSVVKISEEEHLGSLKRSILYEGDILFSIAGTLGRTAIVRNNILPANTNQALAIIRGYKLDAYFLLVVLSGEVVKDYIRKNPTVGAQPNLSLEQVSSLKIQVPSMEEQRAIGAYFSNLDNLINSYQEKISQLETLKKKLLQDMFI